VTAKKLAKKTVLKTPTNVSEYKIWTKQGLNVDFDSEKSVNLYSTNVNIAQLAIEQHQFFAELHQQLSKWDAAYQKKMHSPLLMNREPVKLFKKTYESAVDKSFRRNVLWNAKFPSEPEGGWITPALLYRIFNDLVRTTIVCRFIDGPEFLVSKLTEFATKLKLKSKYYSQERDEGYYAYHFYVFIPVNLLDAEFKEFAHDMEVEIQITTQLQDVLKSLTHKFYEVERLKSEKKTSKWKWDYNSNSFKVSYLSHTLHLLEAIILESRNSVK
jgi:ppGpp synthetase/RelA/SpoT-type nucleotidyltranferase